jgi:DNA-binding response OmpR family regulator
VDKILVVDDEPSVRRLLIAALSKSGYEVIEASDGDEGLRKALEEKPDLIISDVLMPVRDGCQMSRNLRDNPVTALVPIIMLTGLNEEKDELEAFQQGVDDYIVKPVRASVLRAKVAALLSRAHAFCAPETGDPTAKYDTR